MTAISDPSQPHILIHAQHLLGIGHRVRVQRIAAACARAGARVTLADGGLDHGDSGRSEDEHLSAGVEVVMLPGARAADATFQTILDAEGQVIDRAWMARRRALLLELFERIRPHILLLEGYPFARRRFAFELDPLLALAGVRGVRRVCSLRDIPARKSDAAKMRRMLETAAAHIDDILVHGDTGVCRVEEVWPEIARFPGKVIHTGYIGPPSPCTVAHDGHGDGDRHADAGAGAVVVAAGGGAVGGTLFRVAQEARAQSRFSDARWRFFCGPALPTEERQMLMESAESAAGGFEIVMNAGGDAYRAALRRAAFSISQAGYNTSCDIWATGVPAVLVPFAAGGREQEQTIRAELMTARGEAVTLPEADLSASALVEAIDRAAALPPPPLPAPGLDGAEATARILLSRAASRGTAPVPAPAAPYVPASLPICRDSAGADVWLRLVEELNRWADAGDVAEFWWRDDDAVMPDGRLDRLLAVAPGVPRTLAVIPARAQPELADRLAHEEAIRVAPHGWRHVNHAPDGVKKAEFGPHRPAAAMLADIARGNRRLRHLFADRAAPLFVPPWNRMCRDLAAQLPAIGLVSCSLYGPRRVGEGAVERGASGACSSFMLNCHADPVNWRGGGGYAGDEATMAPLIAHLVHKRKGLESANTTGSNDGADHASTDSDPHEPSGILTHHLVHDAGCWAFVGRLMSLLRIHPAARILSLEEALRR